MRFVNYFSFLISSTIFLISFLNVSWWMITVYFPDPVDLYMFSISNFGYNFFLSFSSINFNLLDKILDVICANLILILITFVIFISTGWSLVSDLINTNRILSIRILHRLVLLQLILYILAITFYSLYIVKILIYQNYMLTTKLILHYLVSLFILLTMVFHMSFILKLFRLDLQTCKDNAPDFLRKNKIYIVLSLMFFVCIPIFLTVNIFRDYSNFAVKLRNSSEEFVENNNDVYLKYNQYHNIFSHLKYKKIYELVTKVNDDFLSNSDRDIYLLDKLLKERISSNSPFFDKISYTIDDTNTQPYKYLLCYETPYFDLENNKFLDLLGILHIVVPIMDFFVVDDYLSFDVVLRPPTINYPMTLISTEERESYKRYCYEVTVKRNHSKLLNV